MSLGLELPTRQINVSFAAKRDRKVVKTDIRTLSCPDRISDVDHLKYLGGQLIPQMCEKHHQHELRFHHSFRDIIDPQVGLHLVWYPEKAYPKPMFKWTPEEVVTAVVINSLCLNVMKWQEILTAPRQDGKPEQRTVRCNFKADEATIVIRVGFRRQLHPHKLLRLDLVN